MNLLPNCLHPHHPSPQAAALRNLSGHHQLLLNALKSSSIHVRAKVSDLCPTVEVAANCVTSHPVMSTGDPSRVPVLSWSSMIFPRCAQTREGKGLKSRMASNTLLGSRAHQSVRHHVNGLLNEPVNMRLLQRLNPPSAYLYGEHHGNSTSLYPSPNT